RNLPSLPAHAKRYAARKRGRGHRRAAALLGDRQQAAQLALPAAPLPTALALPTRASPSRPVDSRREDGGARQAESSILVSSLMATTFRAVAFQVKRLLASCAA